MKLAASVLLTTAFAAAFAQSPKVVTGCDGKELFVNVSRSNVRPGETVIYTYRACVRSTYDVLNASRMPMGRTYTKTPIQIVMMGVADPNGNVNLSGRTTLDFGEATFSRNMMVELKRALVESCTLWSETNGQRWRLGNVVVPLTGVTGNR